jgi:SsrA-binding protein
MAPFAVNKKAYHDYEILETYEAGLVLHGHEVKSIREGSITLKGSYVGINHTNELFVHSMHIPPYSKASSSMEQYDPYRTRKLLLHKQEIMKLIGKLAQKGLTLVPLSVYSKNHRIKLEFALVKGKKKVDKRDDLKKKDIQRDIERSFKTR